MSNPQTRTEYKPNCIHLSCDFFRGEVALRINHILDSKYFHDFPGSYRRCKYKVAFICLVTFFRGEVAWRINQILDVVFSLSFNPFSWLFLPALQSAASKFRRVLFALRSAVCHVGVETSARQSLCAAKPLRRRVARRPVDSAAVFDLQTFSSYISLQIRSASASFGSFYPALQSAVYLAGVETSARQSRPLLSRRFLLTRLPTFFRFTDFFCIDNLCVQIISASKLGCWM